MRIIFSPDDTGIRTNEKTLRLIVHTGTTTYTRFVHTIRYYTLLDHKMHAQLRSVRLYIAQQRNVAPCGAVRSRAVPFAAVLCRAARCAFFRT